MYIIWYFLTFGTKKCRHFTATAFPNNSLKLIH